MVVMAPLAAALASTRERMHWLVGGGLVLSGLGGATAATPSTSATVWVGVDPVLDGLTITGSSLVDEDKTLAEQIADVGGRPVDVVEQGVELIVGLDRHPRRVARERGGLGLLPQAGQRPTGFGLQQRSIRAHLLAG